jgi:hypothetical protein
MGGDKARKFTVAKLMMLLPLDGEESERRRLELVYLIKLRHVVFSPSFLLSSLIFGGNVFALLHLKWTQVSHMFNLETKVKYMKPNCVSSITFFHHPYFNKSIIFPIHCEAFLTRRYRNIRYL